MDMEEIEYDAKFRPGTWHLIVAAVGSGKTTFVQRLISDCERYFADLAKPIQLVLCLGRGRVVLPRRSLKMFTRVKEISDLKGELAQLIADLKEYNRSIIIFDDFMSFGDPVVYRGLRELLHGSLRHVGMTLFLVVHDIMSIDKFNMFIPHANRCILMANSANVRSLRKLCNLTFIGKELCNDLVSHLAYLHALRVRHNQYDCIVFDNERALVFLYYQRDVINKKNNNGVCEVVLFTGAMRYLLVPKSSSEIKNFRQLQEDQDRKDEKLAHILTKILAELPSDLRGQVVTGLRRVKNPPETKRFADLLADELEKLSGSAKSSMDNAERSNGSENDQLRDFSW